MKSFLATCKPCKRHLQVTASIAHKVDATRNGVGRILSHKRVSWRVEGGKHDGYESRLAAAWNGKWTISLPCDGCGQNLSFVAVAGEVTDQDCNERCMASHGPSCECSCGGRNHGRSFAI